MTDTRISAADFRALGRRHKYGAKPTTVDGIRFASKREAKRYGELKLLERAGLISCLELQPRFPFTLRGTFSNEAKHIFTYVADFSYLDHDGTGIVVEDVKGVRTEVYKLKRKLIEEQYGITITEV